MTPEEQWSEISYPTFLTGVLAKIKSVRDAMTGVQATASVVSTSLNNVPVQFSYPSDNWVKVDIGLDSANNPQVSLVIPLAWMTG